MKISYAIIAFLCGAVLALTLMLCLRKDSYQQPDVHAPDAIELPAPIQGDWEGFLEDLREEN